MKLKNYFAAHPGARENLRVGLNVSKSYLSQLVHGRTSISVFRATQIERLTEGKVRCEDLRPDVDWVFLRNEQG